tara:strand:- start:326 stop:532 length:207 start_codon:yes stop_codon:yes gene_type:complete
MSIGLLLYGFKNNTGGAGRVRTDGLLDAIQALSQLSYGPMSKHAGLPEPAYINRNYTSSADKNNRPWS